MAHFTSSAALRMVHAGYYFNGPAGTVFWIPDAMVADFIVDPGPIIPGLTWVDTVDPIDGSTITNGTINGDDKLVDGSVGGTKIGDGAIDWAKLAAALKGVPRPVAGPTNPTLPDATYPAGSLILNQTDGLFYRTLDGNTWGAVTDATQITGQLLANQIGALQIQANHLAAILVLASVIKTADTGARCELDSNGFRAYASDGTLLVNLPTNGSAMYFNGQVLATSLQVTGTAELDGAVHHGKSSVTTYDAGVQPPSAAPTLAVQLAAPLALSVTAGWARQGSGCVDSAGGSDGLTACLVRLEYSGTSVRVAEYALSDGSLSRATTISPSGSNPDFLGASGITRLGDYWYVVYLDQTSSVVKLAKLTRATGAISGSPLSLATKFYGELAGGITNDGTDLRILGNATNLLTERIVKCSTAMTYTSTQALTLPSAPAGATQVTPGDIAFADDGDGSGNRFALVVQWDNVVSTRVYQFTTAGAVIANKDWLTSASWGGACGGIYYDGSYWYQNVGNGVQQYTNHNAADETAFVRHTWYDSNATGGTHETTVSPYATIEWLRRHQLSVTTPSIPTGGTDDPDKCRTYIYLGAADPGATGLHLQGTYTGTVLVLNTYASGGAADPATNNFPGGVGGYAQSAGGTSWVHRGDGSGAPPHGSAFPTAVTNDHFFRDDLGLEFYYDGTRWVSSTLFAMDLGNGSNLSAGANWVGSGVLDLMGGSDLWLVSFSTFFNVATGGTALGASHKWVSTLQKGVDSSATMTDVVSCSLASGANGSRLVTTAIGALLNNGTVHDGVRYNVAKTGTPGNTYTSGVLRYRVVAT